MIAEYDSTISQSFFTVHADWLIGLLRPSMKPLSLSLFRMSSTRYAGIMYFIRGYYGDSEAIGVTSLRPSRI